MKAPYFEKKIKKAFTTHGKVSYNYPSHFHTFVETVYCFKGEQAVIINGEEFNLKSGDTAIIFPSVLHAYKKSTDKDSESISVMCDSQVLTSVFPEILSTVPETPIIKGGFLDKSTVDAFSNILLNNNERVIIGYFIVALSDILNKVTLKSSQNFSSTKIARTLTEYIENNFLEDLSIETLSKKFGYSKSYIAHVFCDKLKIPFKKYLNTLRCEYAYNLLKQKDKRVTEVCSMSGFLSLNTFTRLMKSIYGKTPSQIKNSRN